MRTDGHTHPRQHHICQGKQRAGRANPTAEVLTAAPGARRWKRRAGGVLEQVWWQGGIGKTWSQLGDLVVNLKDQMTPVYIKAYRVSNRFNGHDDSAPALTLTTDVSRSGWAVLAKLLKKPPVAFTVTAFDGEVDYDIPGSGEMYTALWEGVTVSN
eukprot:jgi/Mesen1/8099/ME000434S07341